MNQPIWQLFLQNHGLNLEKAALIKLNLNPYQFVTSFYENLFASYPEVEPLFSKTDMDKQGKKLLNSWVLLVEKLRHPEALKPVLQDLGDRHKC